MKAYRFYFALTLWRLAKVSITESGIKWQKWVVPTSMAGMRRLFAGCLTSQQHASVSQGRICSDKSMCCHTEIEVADQTFYLTQSQYTDTRPTSPSANPITPGAWQGSHWSASFLVTGMTRPPKNPGASGIRTRDLPLSRRTPYHSANKAVCMKRFCWKVYMYCTAFKFLPSKTASWLASWTRLNT